MKNVIILSAIAMCLTSCFHAPEPYPRYSVENISFVPDSLKPKHREWITETVRASNQHLSAGDYEDIDETIIQAERTADNLFESNVIGLRKQINEDYFSDVVLRPEQMNCYEKRILDSLLNGK